MAQADDIWWGVKIRQRGKWMPDRIRPEKMVLRRMWISATLYNVSEGNGARITRMMIQEDESMAQVGIVMGSDSDMPVMAKAADILDRLGISYEMTILSAHREPEEFFAYAKGAEAKGFKVIIAGAGMAAHLPGMCAAIFPMPVIGIPMHTTSLGGRDSLYSIVQMPTGIPVATVAINGGVNAGLLAAKILATSDEALLGRLKEYSENMKQEVQAKDKKLQEVGYKNYSK